ncbi:MAG: DUF262 domain-containing protein [Cellulomonadaceae bacterium]|nr:DUF262 domain-containing protein [Cellulomonadaceae bacterium]
MTLEDEISVNRQNIRSDGYAMSIGEMLNLYRDREIRIRPEFQRLFRWTLEKQSRLIESLLLDIPLPTVFVAQSDDGVWEVVDGLQRLSTILQFMGELRDEATGELLPPSTLYETKYLPSLRDCKFQELPPAVRLQLKRARLDFRILLRESDDSVKYELFDRLNSGGMETSPQEVRTALVIMKDPAFHVWLQELRNIAPVANTLALTDRQLSEQYDLELLVRFLVFQSSSREELSSFSDIDSFLTDRILGLVASEEFDRKVIGEQVYSVFDVLWSMGPNVFRRYDEQKKKSVGAFSVSAFEAATAGVASNLASWLEVDEDKWEGLLTDRARELWGDTEFRKYSGAGVRASTRAPRMPEVGERIFRPA